MTAAATCVPRQWRGKPRDALHVNGCTLELNASHSWHRGYTRTVRGLSLNRYTYITSGHFFFLPQNDRRPHVATRRSPISFITPCMGWTLFHGQWIWPLFGGDTFGQSGRRIFWHPPGRFFLNSSVSHSADKVAAWVQGFGISDYCVCRPFW